MYWRFQIGSTRRIAEAEEQQVLHRVLAKVVIDAEHLRLVEHRVHGLVQRAGAGQTKRFFDDHPRAELLEHRAEQLWRDGQVVCRAAARSQGPGKAGECRGDPRSRRRCRPALASAPRTRHGRGGRGGRCCPRCRCAAARSSSPISRPRSPARPGAGGAPSRVTLEKSSCRQGRRWRRRASAAVGVMRATPPDPSGCRVHPTCAGARGNGALCTFS